VLAVTTPTRFESLPDIPTVGEFVPDYVASQWFAIGLRKNTPAEIGKPRLYLGVRKNGVHLL